MEIERGRYFFDRGLRFACTQCGACCTGGPGTVRVNDAEIDALAAHLRLERGDFVRRHLRPMPQRDDEVGYRGDGSGLPVPPPAMWCLTEREDGSCVFYEQGGCRVYAARPAQCRTYPFWLKNLRTEEAWERAARQCPGIGRGPLRSREDILRDVEASPI